MNQLSDYMKRITLDVIGAAGFGFEFNALSDNPDPSVPHYNKALDSSEQGAMSFLAGLFPMCVASKPRAPNVFFNVIHTFLFFQCIC